MVVGVVVASIGMGLGLAMTGLGLYFLLAARPYRQLLAAAGAECVEVYNGWKRGEVWEVMVSVGSKTERHWVEAQELGRFLLQHSLGSFYEKDRKKAKAIEVEAAEALGEQMRWEWTQKSGTVVMEFNKISRSDFSSSRREILSRVSELLTGRVALIGRGLVIDS